MVRMEVLPFVLVALALILCVKFKTQLQNALIGNGRLGFKAMDAKDERFVSRKLAGLLKYQY